MFKNIWTPSQSHAKPRAAEGPWATPALRPFPIMPSPQHSDQRISLEQTDHHMVQHFFGFVHACPIRFTLKCLDYPGFIIVSYFCGWLWFIHDLFIYWFHGLWWFVYFCWLIHACFLMFYRFRCCFDSPETAAKAPPRSCWCCRQSPVPWRCLCRSLRPGPWMIEGEQNHGIYWEFTGNYWENPILKYGNPYYDRELRRIPWELFISFHGMNRCVLLLICVPYWMIIQYNHDESSFCLHGSGGINKFESGWQYPEAN